jgi:hypothetical protein
VREVRPDAARSGGTCCESMRDALQWGLIVEVMGELLLPLRTLTEVDPDAKAGNLETGETYDPAEFQMSMAITYCPWCAVPLTL